MGPETMCRRQMWNCLELKYIIYTLPFRAAMSLLDCRCFLLGPSVETGCWYLFFVVVFCDA